MRKGNKIVLKIPTFFQRCILFRVEIMSKTFKTLAHINASFNEEMVKLFERLGCSSDNLKAEGSKSTPFKPFAQRPVEEEKSNGIVDEKIVKQEKRDEKKSKRPGLEQVFQVEVPKANFNDETSADAEKNPTGLSVLRHILIFDYHKNS